MSDNKIDEVHQGNHKIRNMDLMGEWFSHDEKERVPRIIDKIKLLLNMKEFPDNIYDNMEKKVEYFCLRLKTKLKSCSGNRSYFLKRNDFWLNCEFTLPENMQNMLQKKVKEHPGTSRGRPLKPFCETSFKTKKRRVADLLTSATTEELDFAAKISKTTEKASPSNKTQYCISPEKALTLDLNLSERKYCLLRSVVNSVHQNDKDCFPSKHVLRKLKNEIVPTKLLVTEISAEFDLQELLNKTAQSLLKLLKIERTIKAKLICKWGFDGSGGHSVYKQKFLEDRDSTATDEYFFLIAFVPLRLIELGSNNIIWTNPRTSSTLYCRPIKFIFTKENATLIREEESKMTKLINDLFAYKECQNSTELEVEFQMIFTMFDGSVSNILSGTNSTMKGVICGATPKQMNDENIEQFPFDREKLRFGLSTLHAWIRFFECLLHIAYRLPFKSWQVRSAEHKTIFQESKKRIQLEFKSQMGLLVDKPKQGFGSSNDGNTARRFFSDPKLCSKITGIDQNLIEKFGLILRIISSVLKINISQFKILLADTRNLYLNLYDWYFMPSSVHKLLIHGCDIINSFELPIGQLSEDALEARHKEVRKNRLDHTRKSSRKNTNTDLMRILALTSDPHISSKRNPLSKNRNIDYSDFDIYIDQQPSGLSDPSDDHSIDLGQISISDTSSGDESD